MESHENSRRAEKTPPKVVSKRKILLFSPDFRLLPTPTLSCWWQHTWILYIFWIIASFSWDTEINPFLFLRRSSSCPSTPEVIYSYWISEEEEIFPQISVFQPVTNSANLRGSDHMMVEQVSLYAGVNFSEETIACAVHVVESRSDRLEAGGVSWPAIWTESGVIWTQPALGPHPPTSCPTNPPLSFQFYLSN